MKLKYIFIILVLDFLIYKYDFNDLFKDCNKMKKIFVIFSIVLLSYCSANCQVDKEYRSSVRLMLKLTGVEESFTGMVKQMITMVKAEKTNIPAEFWKGFEKDFISSSVEEIVDKLTPVYQKYLTLDDVNKINEFYKTPAGKKLGEKTPLISKDSKQVGQQWGMSVNQKIQDKLKEKGY